MNFVRCSKGHFYDSDRHASCPKCNVSGVVPTNDVNYGGSTIKQNPATDGDEYKTVKLDFNQAPANDDEYKTVKLDFGGQPTAPAADDEYKTVQFGFDTTPASSPKEEDDDNYKTVSLSSSIKNLQDTYDEYTPEKDAEVLRAAGKEDVYAPVNVETTSAEPENDELTEINPEEDKTEEKAEKIYAALETAEAEVWSEVSEEVKENLEKGKELLLKNYQGIEDELNEFIQENSKIRKGSEIFFEETKGVIGLLHQFEGPPGSEDGRVRIGTFPVLQIL